MLDCCQYLKSWQCVKQCINLHTKTAAHMTLYSAAMRKNDIQWINGILLEILEHSAESMPMEDEDDLPSLLESLSPIWTNKVLAMRRKLRRRSVKEEVEEMPFLFSLG
uniref:Uncharacterized protein LOC117350737 isoform X2 n=1 Tax=Geotrypetes seraphini TaxID=260995 RepID=A0A6P8PIC6_GEOSA|nr:uncharacterized protein LOC117350737 isoform X2 [Geotrypetes seraphini]